MLRATQHKMVNQYCSCNGNSSATAEPRVATDHHEDDFKLRGCSIKEGECFSLYIYVKKNKLLFCHNSSIFYEF